MDKKSEKLLNELSQAALTSEGEHLNKIQDGLQKKRKGFEETSEKAKEYIEKARSKKSNVGIESFFQHYGLDSDEGIAVLSLAEALLRIPDAQTANDLIHDKLKNTDWQSHNNNSVAAMKASTLGLRAAKKLFELGNMVQKITDPVVRESIKQSMKVLGEHFVIGEDIKSAISNSKPYKKKGYKFSYDMLGEGARSDAQAENYMGRYIGAIDSIADEVDIADDLYCRPSVSVKLSALHPKYNLLNIDDVKKRILPRLHSIITHAKEAGIAITIDAEENARLDLSLEIFSEILHDENFQGYEGIGIAVQAYNKHAHKVIEYIGELAASVNKKVPVRLVKGAYWDYEIKNAQMLGLSDYPVFTQKHYTDISYLKCAHDLFKNSHYLYPQFGTHNAITIAEIEGMAGDNPYEFQLLYGMGGNIYDQIVDKHKCRIYAPVGNYEELLPYLIRRLLENSASSSFVKKIADDKISADKIVKNPTEEEPEKTLPLPSNIYGYNRENSSGFNLGSKAEIAYIKEHIKPFMSKQWKACSIIGGKEYTKGVKSFSFLPYNYPEKIGTVIEPTAAEINVAIETVAGSYKSWSKTDYKKRCDVLCKMADLLEENKYEAIALCIKEAGKTIDDAIAEVREAVDFCRYYAMEAKEIFEDDIILKGPTGENNILSYHSRGMFVCISPWNFPLAIFLGQITAALVTGNSVIAKPAEQTSLMAYFAVKLLLKAGLPEDVIAMLPGSGEKVGKYLLNDARTAGVVFTGSLETAKYINRTLSRTGGAIVPFIAETGGQNAMIVDSSALIEQTVDDIVLSAFGSAGQRCSALRILYVENNIADNLIEILKGAMAELKTDSPEDFKNDIGPVIDSKSRDNIKKHIKTMAISHKLIAQAPTAKAENGYFISPTALEVSKIDDIGDEVFGPVLHIIRYDYKNIDKVIEEINNSGYGLTLGIQSRIQKRCDYIKSRVNIGNIYINRSMTGATVGVQPFGGEGLSGTGPKAGGPNYLKRFCTERTFTENTTAVGGNRELLV